MQEWIIVDEQYLNYLREFERGIPYSNYGEDKFKPFFGILFEQGDLVYVTQISHAQPKHAKMKGSLDFHKIYLPNQHPNKPDRLVAVVNLNYMFPVPKSQYFALDYKDIGNHRTFKSPTEESKYIDLLRKEMKQINTLNLENDAKKIFDLKANFPNDRVAMRCLDFIKLEELATMYIPNN